MISQKIGEESKLTFYGGTGTVTGANFLIESSNEEKKLKICKV